MSTQPLTLSFDPRTIEHLGVRMYSHVPNAVAELVANAYDADATQVEVHIGEDDSITVKDDGHGMSRSDVAEKYLRIGRNRREAEDSTTTESGRRRVSGKKGLGKLALFGIGLIVEVKTTRKGVAEATRIKMSYRDLMSSEGEYRPCEDSVPVASDEHGTTVVLTQLRRKTAIDINKLAASLSRLFNYTDNDFTLTVTDAKGGRIGVSRSLRLGSLEREFEWKFPEDFTTEDSFLKGYGVRGVIVSTVRPLRNVPRGVTLYAHGRMVDEPEFFGASESSHAYSYITGHLDVDFVDDNSDEDMIATDRRSLVWDSSEMEQFRKSLADLLTRIGREWRTKRSEERRSRSRQRTGISTEEWMKSIKSDELRSSIMKILECVSSEELDLTAEQQADLTKTIHHLIPEHADYVWRRLHPKIQKASQSAYERDAYHSAVVEAIKEYASIVAERSGLSRDKESQLFNKAFGDKGVLTILDNLLKDTNFTKETADNIERGQQFLSTGVHCAFRNPISHEAVEALQDSGILTYEDCLDALSILSHLMRRVDGAVRRDQ